MRLHDIDVALTEQTEITMIELQMYCKTISRDLCDVRTVPTTGVKIMNNSNLSKSNSLQYFY